jgi:hypothetical protein
MKTVKVIVEDETMKVLDDIRGHLDKTLGIRASRHSVARACLVAGAIELGETIKGFDKKRHLGLDLFVADSLGVPI